MRPSVVVLALMACAVDDARTLPVAQAGPSSTLELSMDPLIPGARAVITVTGAAPGEQVYVMRTTAGEGAGDCPSFLGGNCMDMVGPYTLTLRGRANNLGVVTWTIPSFPSIPPTDVWFQAVTLDGVNSNESEVWYGPVLGACAADAYEPNDTLLTAQPISDGAYPNLSACLSDDDFFLVQDVPPGHYVAATATFDHDAEGDLDLYFWDDFDSIVGSSVSATSNENAVWLNDSTDVMPIAVRIEVYRDDVGIPGIPYELDIEVAPPAPCVDDVFEDNDVEADATAAPIGSVWSAMACADASGADVDWYTFDVPAGDIAEITVLGVPGDGQVEGFLYDGNGQELDADQFGDINLTAVGNGQPVLLGVRQTQDDPRGGGVAYDAIVEISQPDPCVVDVDEPNDDSASATVLSGAVSLERTGCPGDSDWYRIDLVANELVDISLSHDPMGGDQDVDITLYDQGLGVVDSEDRDFTSPESVRGAPTAAETFFIEVVTASDDLAGGGVDYTLDLDILQLTPCLPDGFEPNDLLSESTPLAAGTYPDLTTCNEGSGGYDYYAVSLSAGETLTATVDFSHAEGDIDVDLLGPVGNTLATSATVRDQEIITWTVTSSQTLYLRTELFRDYGNTMPGNGYSITIDIN